MASHTFFCIDAHTCGNPVRLVAGGAPLLDGASMSERRRHFLAAHDWCGRGRRGRLHLDTPAGRVVAEYRQEGEHVASVRLYEEERWGR
jgi:proline racemase